MNNVVAVLTITPSDDGALVVSGASNGGVRGDNRALKLVFQALNLAYRYQIEIVDGSGAYDITLPLEAKNGTLEYEIPAAWTAPGTAALRLVAVGIGDDPVVRHYGPLHLHFADREDGAAMGEMLPRWQTVMAEAQQAAKEALVVAENASKLLRVTIENGYASHTPAEIKAFRDGGGFVVLNDNALLQQVNDTYAFFTYHEITSVSIWVTEYFFNEDRRVNSGKLLVDISPLIDTTLSISGAAADAKVVGDRFAQVDANIDYMIPLVNRHEDSLGDIETALDSILAIQDGFIGGDVE